MKTPSQKSFPLCPSRSHPLTDRFITNRSKGQKKYQRCLDLNSVMGRLQMFQNDDPNTPGSDCLGEQIVQQVQRMKMIPKRNFKCLQSFEVVRATFNPYDNLIDWSSKGMVTVGVGSDIQISNLKHYSTVMPRNKIAKVYSLKFQEEGMILASGDTSGAVQIWDVVKEYPVRNISSFYKSQGNLFSKINVQQGQIYSLLWDSSILYTGSEMSICSHDLSMKNTVINEYQRYKNVPVQSMSFTHNKIAAGYNNGAVVIWDVRNRKVLEQKKHGEDGFNFVKWCPWKLNHLACGFNNKVLIWESDSFTTKSQYKSNETITGLKVNSKDHQIIVSTDFPTSHVGVLTEDLVPVTTLPGFKNAIIGMCLSHDQTSVCALSMSKFGKVWNIAQNSKSSKEAKRPKKSSKFSMR